MSQVDVWEIAQRLDAEITPNSRKDIEEFVSSKNGVINAHDLVELIGIVNTNNKKFTIELIRLAIDELQKDK